MAASDQCALGPDGQLLNISKIVWHNDPDDAQPIQPMSSMEGAVFLLITLGTIIQCSIRSTLTPSLSNCRYMAGCSHCSGEA